MTSAVQAPVLRFAGVFEGFTGTVRACTVGRVLSGAGWSIRPTRTPPMSTQAFRSEATQAPPR